MLVVADIHGNLPALESIIRQERTWELFICLGDLVDYGPWPHEVVQIVMENADYCIKGNHDHAVFYPDECGYTPEYEELTETTKAETLPKLNSKQLQYLRKLSYHLALSFEDDFLHLVHGSYQNPLYGFLYPGSSEEEIRKEMKGASGKVLFAHSHYAFKRSLNGHVNIFNPGSVGFPKDGDHRASYLVIENGEFIFKRAEYDIRKVIKEIKRMRVPDRVKNALIYNLERGKMP